MPNSRRYIEWGVQNRYTDLTTDLNVDSDNMITTGFAGTQTTRTGAYDPNASGNSVVRATLGLSPTAVCGTGNLSHIGTFRVKARIYAVPASGTPSDIQVRLSYQDGDGPFRALPYAPAIVANSFCEVDLGVITIERATLGTQRWTGRVEAVSIAAGDTVDIDHLVLIPVAEGYGKARAAYSYNPGAVVGRDEFTSTTAGGALSTRVAPAGGTWATSGATTDFVFSDGGFGVGSEELTRTTTSDATNGRFAVIGSTTFTDVEVGVAINSNVPATAQYWHGVLARYIDASNWLMFRVQVMGSFGGIVLATIVQNVAGVLTAFPLNTYIAAPIVPGGASQQLRFVVYASGYARASILSPSGSTLFSASMSSSVWATGGALASGKPGITDWVAAAVACSRFYDNFYVATPAVEPIVLYAGRQAEIRSDGALRQDASGTYDGNMPSYRGSRVYLPPAGDKNRITRLLVKADRNDIETAEDVPLGDVLQVQIVYTPRYIAVPR